MTEYSVLEIAGKAGLLWGHFIEELATLLSVLGITLWFGQYLAAT
jgi:hypothetical protein